MLGLLVLALTCFLIVTLIKNALMGQQLSKNEQFLGQITLILPIDPKDQFEMNPWINALNELTPYSSQIRILVLIDGHHYSAALWEKLKSEFSFLDVKILSLKDGAKDVTSDVVIIGDPDLIPTPHAFISAAHYTQTKKRVYVTVPQTSKESVLSEAIFSLNPVLAFTSIYGFTSFKRPFTHPLLSLSRSWMTFPREVFSHLTFDQPNTFTWKEMICTQLEGEKQKYYLAFGEKQLIRYYPTKLKDQLHKMKSFWEILWTDRNRKGFWIFTAILFIWSYPLMIFTNFFSAIFSLLLLFVYRFFSKIVFQESIRSIVLHPLACLAWIGTFFWYFWELLIKKKEHH